MHALIRRCLLPGLVAGAILLASAGFSQQKEDEKNDPVRLLEIEASQEDMAVNTEGTLLFTGVMGAGMQDTRLNLDLRDVPVTEALKQVAENAKVGLKVDDDVPKEAKITLKANNIRLTTALELITQSAGINWTREITDGKTTIRVGKTVRPGFIIWRNNMPGRGAFTLPNIDIAHIDPKIRIEGDLARIYSMTEMMETRSTFNCPHCKKQATVLRRNQQPRCTTCSRPFQSGWQVCPFDGTKRPAAQGEWKYCPFCGKAVKMDEKAEKN